MRWIALVLVSAIASAACQRFTRWYHLEELPTDRSWVKFHGYSISAEDCRADVADLVRIRRQSGLLEETIHRCGSDCSIENGMVVCDEIVDVYVPAR